MAYHSFDSDIAVKYGVNCAVLLNNINFWIEKNRANEKHFYDGRYWTYNSVKAFSEMFPYLTARQIQIALQRLRDDGIIEVGHYGDDKMSRTLWYSITKKGESILHGRKDTFTSTSSTFNADVKYTIADINTDSKPYIKHGKQQKFSVPSVSDVNAYCKERGNNVDAQRFVDYYTANGWMVGKNHMKDWKAAIRTWERNGNGQQRQQAQPESEEDRLNREASEKLQRMYEQYERGEPLEKW